MRFSPKRKPFQSRRFMAFVIVGLATLVVGFAAASQITYEAINQTAYATARCGDVQSNLDFAAEARVALFTREKMTPSIALSALVAGLLAAALVPNKAESLHSSGDLKRLSQAMSESGFGVEDVIEILKASK